MPNIDVNPAQLKIILSLIEKYLPDTTVWAYGSRATWSARPKSDLDLVAFASADQKNAVYDLKEAFEESDLPFRVDFFVWDQVPDEFRVNIERERVVLVEEDNGPETLVKNFLLADAMDAIIDYRGKTPKKSFSGVPLVTAKIVKSGRINKATEFISKEDYSSWMRRGLPHIGDVVMTTEAPLGEVGQIKDEKIALAQRIVTLRGKEGLLDNGYLLYLLQAPSMQAQLDARSSGSTVKGIKQKELRKISLPLPTLNTQKAIAHILGTLDDKIDLNRHMNETLEAMAQAIFKSWFVDFDGCTEFEDSELGRVPKGWRVGTLKEIATNARKTVKPKELTESVPYFGLEHMPRNSISLSQWGNSEKIASNKYGFKAGDFLFGKLRPYFHKVGIAPVDGLCSTDILVIRPTEKVFYPLVMSIISSNHFVDYTTQLSNGAKMPRTNWKDMGKYEILIPDSDTCLKFKKLVNPLYKKIQENIFQSRSLTSLRDSLLPKLISGELRVD